MKLLFTLLTLTAACYGAHRDHGDGAAMSDGGVDAPVCGSTTCDDAPASTCEGTTLHTFDTACEGNACSYSEATVDCGTTGCCGDHCCAFAPSNSGEFGSVEANGLSIAPPNGGFDTSNECASPSALGACSVVTRVGLLEACVCRADRFTIGDLRVTGKRALVLFAHREVIVTGKLDLSGRPNVDGPGWSYVYTTPVTSKSHGGIGGSYATKGGGSSDMNASDVYGDASLIPLEGGARGQPSGGSAGGGGGALQISARETIQVTGVINVGGGGGGGGPSSYGGAGAGGGGSGGAVLLEAHTLIVNGTIVANGGGGGGGGGERHTGDAGVSGGNATDPLQVATGGDGDDGGGCILHGYTSGGTGGVGGRGVDPATAGGPRDGWTGCGGSTFFVGGGGGGGGVGRIRINAKTGCQCSGKISPNPTYGTVVSQ